MEDLLLDTTRVEKNFKLASRGQRLTNYIIDLIFFYIFIFVFSLIFFAVFSTFGEDEVVIEGANTINSNFFTEWLFGAFVILFYYTLTEYFFKGKTLGKLITKTRAVTLDNERLDFKTVLKRSLCRLIPFEQFSFLSENDAGLHDKLSKTKVIIDDQWNEFII